MIAAVEKAAGRFDWIALHKKLPTIALVIAAFAGGGWLTSIRDKAADLPYKNRSTHQLQQVEAVTGSHDPAGTVRCLAVKSVVATKLAHDAVNSANSDTLPTPSLASIPVCPPPKAATIKSAAAIDTK